jgi:Zn-dependent peptidase ImmA (M78 family)/transcriptional regulator with XRE-family HTH domain
MTAAPSRANKPQFNPEMLILAREFHALTAKELAEKLKVSSAYVCQLESNVKEPSEEMIDRLVSELKFPKQFYFEAGRRESVHPSFYRRRVVISPIVLRQCSAKMSLIRRNIERLLSQVSSIDVRIPFIDPDECSGGVKEVAQKARLHLRIPPGPISNLTEVLEEAGVIIVLLDFGTRKIDACGEWVSGHPVIFLNRAAPPSRVRHTLSHEVGHLIMHKFITEECEHQADHFASEFNLPEDEIKSELIPMNLDRLARLKLKWKSSMQAILYRAEALGAISTRTARYNWMLMRRYRYHELEPHEDMMPVERPTALRELVEVFTSSYGFTHEQIIEFLLTFDEFYNEVFLDQPVLRAVA